VRGASRQIEQESNSVRLTNSQNFECIVEFQSESDRNAWTELILGKAEEIDQFLKKDKFKFGNFGQFLSAD